MSDERQPTVMDLDVEGRSTMSSDERHRDRPPVWDAVETDLFCWAPDRRRPSSAEGFLRGEAARISLALAVATLTLVAIRPAADALTSLAIAGLIGLFCYLSQDRR